MRRKQLTPDDECRMLHEAYQFLFRKYDLGEKLEVTNMDAFKTGEDLGGYEADAPKDQSIVFIQIP